MVSLDENLLGKWIDWYVWKLFIDRESHLKGCIDGSCTKLCLLGVADCSKSVPVCEYGYFLFKEKYCV